MDTDSPLWHIPPQYLMLCMTPYHDKISSWPNMRNFRCVATRSRTILMLPHLLLNCGKALLLSSDPPFMSARKEIVNRKPQFLESFWNCYSAFKYPPIKIHRKSLIAKVFLNRLLLFEVLSFSNVEVWVSEEFYKIPFQSCWCNYNLCKSTQLHCAFGNFTVCKNCDKFCFSLNDLRIRH